MAIPLLLITGLFFGFSFSYYYCSDKDRLAETNHTEASETRTLYKAIKASTGHEIIEFDPTLTPHQEALELLHTAADSALHHFNQSPSPLHGLARINEASKFFEQYLLEAINTHNDFHCAYATTSAGKTQRSGYPDLLITHRPSATRFYLDPKLYQEDLVTSTQRTFYYSPKSTNQKITSDAVHLLIGFAHDGNDGSWKFTAWKITDLHSLPLHQKTEYNSSNKELYRSLLRKSDEFTHSDRE